jgi:two-component system, NarL family, nitrate/nitrite response regulator NarL
MSGSPPLSPRPDPPRVTVLAPDPLVRAALSRLLADQGLLVGDLATADLALVDVGAGRLPSLAIPVVALVDDAARPAELLGAGASAVLRRDIDPSRLCAALLAVMHGLVVVDAALARDALPEQGPSEAAEELTARERQVLMLVAGGLSNRRIAERLGISEHTAKFHVNSILTKLGVSTRTEAVVVAARRGLLWL